MKLPKNGLNRSQIVDTVSANVALLPAAFRYIFTTLYLLMFQDFTFRNPLSKCEFT